ncbi:MAG TPA: sulfatase-like hydrolase/transferase [Chitinophagaceae bacterium]|nr:sulfatase-like hydrolase/transferase [Chitinophagaceae bacterium]HQX72570.1 sulfatase-like hydrolase/transferase [Chitinophagaceae bacterium]HQZ74060.1 sulfatase-like hydrolase/transferase [Chitinophagaceae bacterium]
MYSFIIAIITFEGQKLMLVKYKIPKTILWVANLFVIFLLIFTLFRLATFFAFKPKGISFGDVVPSFLMGFRYDLRWIAIILMPIVLFSTFPRLSPFYSSRNKKWWTWYLAIVTFIVFFFFAAGFGSFSYNRTPLDAGAMNFAEDFSISLKMIWQTYPLIWMLLGLLVAVLFFRWMYHRSHWQVINRTEGLGITHRRKFFIITVILLCFFIYGSLSWPPLSRSDSFRYNNSFKSYLAINPLQNFVATLKLRKPDYNERKAREVFPVMAEWMELPDKSDFSFRREIGPRSSSFESRPNIVLVQCESFSMYKSTMSGNPLNATPFFDSLSRQGIFFERCFSPHFSTARALFAILSGIPDAQLFKFSSRNPQAVQQHTIVDNLEDYEKHYFLGGSPEFNNFEGLLKNIDGLQMHTGDYFKAPKVNVWGISDKDLFLEANELFRKKDKPFFAYIQTSGNHRPYNKTIPESDTDFVRVVVPEEELIKYGFESLDEYNCFRYSDYCFRMFMEAARKENYFHNTIFVFVGDHGLAGNAEAMYPPVWTEQRLTDEHVPLLFYAPDLLVPQRRSEVVSQIDVLPTIAGMLHQSYVNTSLGRDLLDPGKKNNFAFITNTADGIGMVTDDFYFTRNINSGEEQLNALHSGVLNYTTAKKDSVRKKLSVFTTAFYETSKYLMMNNQND